MANYNSSLLKLVVTFIAGPVDLREWFGRDTKAQLAGFADMLRVYMSDHDIALPIRRLTRLTRWSYAFRGSTLQPEVAALYLLCRLPQAEGVLVPPFRQPLVKISEIRLMGHVHGKTIYERVLGSEALPDMVQHALRRITDLSWEAELFGGDIAT